MVVWRGVVWTQADRFQEDACSVAILTLKAENVAKFDEGLRIARVEQDQSMVMIESSLLLRYVFVWLNKLLSTFLLLEHFVVVRRVLVLAFIVPFAVHFCSLRLLDCLPGAG